MLVRSSSGSGVWCLIWIVVHAVSFGPLIYSGMFAAETENVSILAFAGGSGSFRQWLIAVWADSGLSAFL